MALYFPLKSSVIIIKGWARGDGTAVPRLVLYTPDGDEIAEHVFTASTDWQYFELATPWPCSAPVDQDGIYARLVLYSTNLNTGLYVEFDDVSISQTSGKTPRISCWECKHFQHAIIGPGIVTRMGECRALAPLRCYPAQPGYQPIFAGMIDAPAEWCSAWQKSTKDVPPIPDVPSEWLYTDQNPPPIYPYTPA
jgi:hypothetical protein